MQTVDGPVLGSTGTDGTLNRETDFRAIYDIFQPKVLWYLTRLVGEDEAEDLTQEVFVKVSQALSRFRQESHLSTWVYRIATNTALDTLRRPSFQHAVREGISDAAATEEMSPTVEQQLIRREMKECIRGFVQSLPVDFRSVVVLSELEQLTNRQIAEVLGISLATVKIRLHRARALLKKEFASRCSFYRDEGNGLVCDPKIDGVSFPDSPPSIRLERG